MHAEEAMVVVRAAIEWAALGIEMLGALVIVVGVLRVAITRGTVRFLLKVDEPAAFDSYKHQIGRSLLLGLEFLVHRTRLGLAMRAVSYDTRTAALMGIPVDRVISFTFVVGSALAAAGFLNAAKYPGLNQAAHPTWILLGLKAFVAAVVGGIGNLRGAMAGGLLIGLVELFGAAYLSPHLRDVYVFVLLLVVLLVRPEGLLGKAVKEKV